jgi:hypothetical protein
MNMEVYTAQLRQVEAMVSKQDHRGAAAHVQTLLHRGLRFKEKDPAAFKQCIFLAADCVAHDALSKHEMQTITGRYPSVLLHMARFKYEGGTLQFRENLFSDAVENLRHAWECWNQASDRGYILTLNALNLARVSARPLLEHLRINVIHQILNQLFKRFINWSHLGERLWSITATRRSLQSPLGGRSMANRQANSEGVCRARL